jgi:hypothetical protein
MDFQCFKCKQPIVFSAAQVGKNGRKIPLDPDTLTPHDCPMREKPTGTAGWAVPEEDKDDHGNELDGGTIFKKLLETQAEKYVDHTLKPELKLKTLIDPTPEGIDLKYNRLAAEQNVRYSQSHVSGSQYTMFVWYEEVK